MINLIVSCFICILIFALPVVAQQQSPATKLPQISLIGNILAESTSTKKDLSVKEIELSFQHYLYPSVKANVFMALHKEADGNRKFELEEAYVQFSDVFATLFNKGGSKSGIGSIVGKKQLGIGKINPLHPEQWEFADRSIATEYVFGKEHSLAAEGLQVMKLLPTPFFSQLELGYWTAAAHEEEEGAGHTNIEYKNRLMTARLWNSFSLTNESELELGLNYLIGNASAASADDKQEIFVTDITLTKDISKNQQLKLVGELYQSNYGEEGEARATQTGGFLSATYDINPQYNAGIRYGLLGQHGDEGQEQTQLSYMLTRQLTDTSKFRVQINTGNNTENQVLAQFIFGMGPHAHVLQ